MIHCIISDHIIARGANHQALAGDALMQPHEDILRMFLKQVEELEEDKADEIMKIGVGDLLEELLEKAIEGCVQILRMERPSKEKVKEVVGVVRKYKPKMKGQGLS